MVFFLFLFFQKLNIAVSKTLLKKNLNKKNGVALLTRNLVHQSAASRVPTPIQLWLLLFCLPCSLEAFWCWENGGETVAQMAGKTSFWAKPPSTETTENHPLKRFEFPHKSWTQSAIEISIFQSYMIVTEETACQRFVIRFTSLCQHSWKAMEKSGPALLLKTGRFWSHWCRILCCSRLAWVFVKRGHRNVRSLRVLLQSGARFSVGKVKVMNSNEKNQKKIMHGTTWESSLSSNK